MTTTTLITTLALSFNDVLTFAFIALFIVGPWISKAMKKAGQSGSRPTSGRSTVRHTPSRDLPSATDLALRRQKRLQELAQRRRTAATGQQPPRGPEPSNLSMAQRLERQRAKAMYEQRARKLRQQQTQPQQPHTVIQQPTQRPQQQIAQQRLARQHARQIKRQQQRQRAEALRYMTQQRKAAAAKLAQPQQRPKLSRIATKHDRGIVHRHVPDAPTTTVTAAHRPRIRYLNARSLRNAIMLKEILDPPVALRQPSAETNY